MKPVALDLCCGKGGWAHGLIAAGFDVIGFDVVDFSRDYPGTFRLASVEALAEDIGSFNLPPLALIVASPPCQEFARHDMPWTRKRNPPPPNRSLWEACVKIAQSLRLPLILENVRGAQPFMGKAACHCGPFYLWGDVPALMPIRLKRRHKESMSSTARADRAMVPFELAYHIGQVFHQGVTN